MENMNDDHMHGMMNNKSDGGLTTAMHPHKMMMHMTFFWGSDAQILFSGWPGTSTGMYVLALIVVFVLAFTSEFVSNCRLLKPGSDNHVTAGLVQTLLHALRVGLAYLVMLAIMSFNGGVFLAAVSGHLLGFLLFGSQVFNKSSADVPAKTSDHLPPPMSC
ncbi:Copper transporter 6 [Hibiscus syriacus]|uniref:Copper transport protein n=1 Tax=Hibiscus syriacus TaxID=106335 RepID=A0A6A2ZJU9_HIBSY|nr:copper transporter 2-like [Hibiscus syriacus]KAE8691777.1 Copper transporter 6 [Hibiscus syriacus]